MSSYLRRLQRKAARVRGDYEPAERPFVLLPDGGYQVLHPTRGWHTFSKRRLDAGAAMAGLLDLADKRRGRA